MRAYGRLKIDLQIRCDFGGESKDVQLYNLSRGGCMIELDDAPGDNVEAGTEVKIQLGDAETVPGKVAWLRKRNLGVEFCEPISRETVEEFGYPDDEDFDRDDPRDRYGLPLVSNLKTAAGHID